MINTRLLQAHMILNGVTAVSYTHLDGGHEIILLYSQTSIMMITEFDQNYKTKKRKSFGNWNESFYVRLKGPE